MSEQETQQQQSAAPKEPQVSKTPQPPTSGPLAGLESWLYDMLVVKAPFQLPKGFTDWVVKYGPWITLVIGLLMLPALFGLLTLVGILGAVATVYSVVAFHPAISLWFWLAFLLLIAQVVVMFVSIPMLLKRRRLGWQLLFYADLVSFGYSVFNAVTYGSFGSFIGSLIGVVIGLYLIFQIRHYYVK